MHFVVQYEIDIDADTPLQAAQEADEIMRSPESLPPVLDVRDDRGAVVRVDLEDENEQPLAGGEPQMVLVIGNPMDGIRFVGPFNGGDDANEYADAQYHGDDWWAADIDPPKRDMPAVSIRPGAQPPYILPRPIYGTDGRRGSS